MRISQSFVVVSLSMAAQSQVGLATPIPNSPEPKNVNPASLRASIGSHHTRSPAFLSDGSLPQAEDERHLLSASVRSATLTVPDGNRHEMFMRSEHHNKHEDNHYALLSASLGASLGASHPHHSTHTTASVSDTNTRYHQTAYRPGEYNHDLLDLDLSLKKRQHHHDHLDEETVPLIEIDALSDDYHHSNHYAEEDHLVIRGIDSALTPLGVTSLSQTVAGLPLVGSTLANSVINPVENTLDPVVVPLVKAAEPVLAGLPVVGQPVVDLLGSTTLDQLPAAKHTRRDGLIGTLADTVNGLPVVGPTVAGVLKPLAGLGTQVVDPLLGTLKSTASSLLGTLPVLNAVPALIPSTLGLRARQQAGADPTAELEALLNEVNPLPNQVPQPGSVVQAVTNGLPSPAAGLVDTAQNLIPQAATKQVPQAPTLPQLPVSAASLSQVAAKLPSLSQLPLALPSLNTIPGRLRRRSEFNGPELFKREKFTNNLKTIEEREEMNEEDTEENQNECDEDEDEEDSPITKRDRESSEKRKNKPRFGFLNQSSSSSPSGVVKNWIKSLKRNV